MNPHRKTFSAKPAEAQAQRGWWVVDAANVPLGRLASVVAQILRGKNKPTFTPHVDVGDFVVVVNADKVKLTGNKWTQKHYYHHSGFPGGLRKIRYDDLVKKKPEMPLHEAVRGMLPKSSLGRQLIKKLKIYAGPDHPHTAQMPKALDMSSEEKRHG